MKSPTDQLVQLSKEGFEKQKKIVLRAILLIKRNFEIGMFEQKQVRMETAYRIAIKKALEDMEDLILKATYEDYKDHTAKPGTQDSIRELLASQETDERYPTPFRELAHTLEYAGDIGGALSPMDRYHDTKFLMREYKVAQIMYRAKKEAEKTILNPGVSPTPIITAHLECVLAAKMLIEEYLKHFSDKKNLLPPQTLLDEDKLEKQEIDQAACSKYLKLLDEYIDKLKAGKIQEVKNKTFCTDESNWPNQKNWNNTRKTGIEVMNNVLGDILDTVKSDPLYLYGSLLNLTRLWCNRPDLNPEFMKNEMEAQEEKIKAATANNNNNRDKGKDNRV